MLPLELTGPASSSILIFLGPSKPALVASPLPGFEFMKSGSTRRRFLRAADTSVALPLFESVRLRQGLCASDTQTLLPKRTIVHSFGWSVPNDVVIPRGFMQVGTFGFALRSRRGTPA